MKTHKTGPKISSPQEEQARSEKYVASLVDRVLKSAEDALLSDSYAVRQQLLLDLANVQGEIGVKWFCRKWASKLREESLHDLTKIRDDLRQIWQIRNAVQLNVCTWSVGGAESHIPPVLHANQILNEWLSWRPTAEQEQAYKATQFEKEQQAKKAWEEADEEERLSLIFGGREPEYEGSQWILPGGYVPFSCWLPRRSLVPDTRSLRPMLIQGVFEHWGQFKYCANSECATPYFIAKRKDQVVCNAEICKAERQRQHVSKWWNENRAKKSQKKGVGKTTKKGTGENVTRKAR